MTVDEIKARLGEIKTRMAELDDEFKGQALPDEQRAEWNKLEEEREGKTELLAELEFRMQRLNELKGDEKSREQGAHFQVRKEAVRGDDIYDLSTVRMTASSPDEAVRELRDRAMRSVESAVFPAGLDADRCRGTVERLINRHDIGDTDSSVQGEVSRRILATGSPTYRRAFTKYLAGRALTPDEQRALSVGTGSAGGFAVVYTLDPTVIRTSNFSVNPYRAIARQETIAGTNEWRGVTSAGISAAYAAEGTEASDNSPTLAQPSVVVQRAQAFVPFSIELGQDWGSLQTEMAGLIQDAKDDLEATQFTTGTGTPPNPQGLLTGAVTTVAASGVASFAVGDLYALEQAVPPRFRPRAVMLGNRFVFNKVRQFDTAGGSAVWSIDVTSKGQLQAGLDNIPYGADQGNLGSKIIGYEAREASAMAAALTTGSKILAMGDPRYYIIVDRVGMDIEVIPHLFGATNRFPTGQRGLFAYWRNGARVLDANAFRVLVTG